MDHYYYQDRAYKRPNPDQRAINMLSKHAVRADNVADARRFHLAAIILKPCELRGEASQSRLDEQAEARKLAATLA